MMKVIKGSKCVLLFIVSWLFVRCLCLFDIPDDYMTTKSGIKPTHSTMTPENVCHNYPIWGTFIANPVLDTDI